MKKTIVTALTLLGLHASLAIASDERVVVPNHEPTSKACTDCHMLFPPQMLPKASWEKIMNSLDNHFGENATLDEATRKQVSDFLQANSGDSGSRRNHHFLRGMRAGDVPLRITETPYWQREHKKEVSPEAFARPEVKSAANCPACHKRASEGYYED
ncbi:MAG: cytochrome C [Magnetococcales bacterium]|nr:diheme cytochrome c [Magnetococcales bacterium]NGZ27855.1 cytochrome C [Magnetococcales bacterium]